MSTRKDHTLFTLLVFLGEPRLFIPDQPPNETHRILFLFLASLFCIYSLVCAVLLVQSEFGLDNYHPRLLDTPPICVKRGRAFRFLSYLFRLSFIYASLFPSISKIVSASLWYTLSYVPYGRATARRMLQSAFSTDE